MWAAQNLKIEAPRSWIYISRFRHHGIWLAIVLLANCSLDKRVICIVGGQVEQDDGL